MQAYEKLQATFRRLNNLKHMAAILHWDEAVMMPAGGGSARADAMAEITALSNETLGADQLPALLEVAKLEVTGDWQTASLREMAREIHRVHQVDPALTVEQTRTRFLCEQAWRHLRPQNNFRDFLPHLKKVVSLAREEAQQRGQALGLAPYDAMAEQFEPGGRKADYTAAFGRLKAELPAIIERRRQKQKPFIRAKGPFAIPDQKRLGLELMKAMQFDFAHGRLDVAVHPFCGGVSDDVRVTTRYDENDWTESVMAVIHETGHASYEQGLPAEYRWQPVGQAIGMSWHESISLFFEMQMAHTPEFLTYLAPLAERIFQRRGDPAFTAENLKNLYGWVEPTLIRVTADEATYPCHVILRFELESALVEGAIECEDLPGLWDEKMHALLGLHTKGNDRDGVMQDVHWPSGAFGYFPCYTMGAMMAAQMAARMRQDLPDLGAQLARGDWAAIRTWLKERVWQHGRLKSSRELLTAAAGAPLDPGFLLKHLERSA